MKINEVYSILNNYAPTSLSDSYVKEFNVYDNVGIIVDLSKEITGILFTLDLTSESVDRAIENNCNLIFTHHPAIYAPIKNITCDMPIYKAINNSIGVISFHLNLDIVNRGIDYYLAKGLGAKDEKILEVLSEGVGYGRTFSLDLTLDELTKKYVEEFNSSKVLVYSEFDSKVKNVATLCGAGLNEDMLNLLDEVDTIISSDVPHHVIIKALEMGKNLIIVTHYSSEIYGFKKVYENLKDSFNVKTVLNIEDKYL